ncbi:MAG: O-antigen ligase family protein, partial [Candidatus Marinimicrobia bacterium]|nr:O-antigen ligase family protein [Candidatus Neomarinimicrobiota bacterium]
MKWGYIVPKELFFQFSVTILLCIQLAKPNTSLKINLLDLILLSWLLLPMIVSIITGDTEDLSGRYTLSFYFMMFFILVKLMHDQNDEDPIIRFMEKTFSIISLTGLFMAFYGILQYFNIDPFHPEGIRPFGPRVVGTIGHANAFGGYLAAIFPLTVISGLYSSRRLWKTISIGALPLILCALILTLSRGAWLAAIAGILIALFPQLNRLWQKYLKRRIYQIAAIPIAIGSLFLGLRFIYQLNPASALGRLFIWHITWNMFADHPLAGIGYGRYGVEYLNYQANFFDDPSNATHFDLAANLKQADNEYLQILAETGIVGFLLFLALFVIFFSIAIRIMKKTGREHDRSWVIFALVGSITVIAAHSLVDNPLNALPTKLIFLFIIANISMLAINIQNRQGSNTFGLTLRNSRLLLPIAIALLVFNAYWVVHMGEGFIHWQKGQKYVAEGLWHNGIIEYERAIEVLPNEGELQFHLGAAYAYTKQAQRAIPFIESSKSNFNDKNIYIVQGSTFLQLGRHEEAESSF